MPMNILWDLIGFRITLTFASIFLQYPIPQFPVFVFLQSLDTFPGLNDNNKKKLFSKRVSDQP